ncbi:MAG TPA: amidohydrolase family protein [Pyrinomonadaceae bacterium]|nr:amidohydrolase family protein [Pyrinomonadaceae bacterium]
MYPGNAVTIKGYWDGARFPFFALREEAAASGQNVILVAPSLGPVSEAGSLVKRGGFDSFMQQVIEPYLRRAHAAGIDKTIVVAAFHSDYAKANAQLAGIIARYPTRLNGFAFVHARRDAGRIYAMVKRAVTVWGFRGIKAHGHDAMPTREVCEVARALHLPMLVDVVGQAYIMEMLAPQYPDVKFIIPHLGSFADDWRAQQQVVDQLVRFPNVYADTSGVRRFDYIVQAVKRAGARKLLFGTDGPWLHPEVELHKIRALGLSPDEESLILGGNILRLLRQSRSARRSARAAHSHSSASPAIKL